MGIKPALGWLGLLLFMTAAHAESGRELFTSRAPAWIARARAPRTPAAWTGRTSPTGEVSGRVETLPVVSHVRFREALVTADRETHGPRTR
jgi:hypothetical protein